MSRLSLFVAAALAFGAVGWLASGMVTGEAVPAPKTLRAELRLPLVAISRMEARSVQRFITGQGDVEAFRQVAARSQSAGRVTETFVDYGTRVEQGEPILSLSLEGLDSRLREAEGVLGRRQSDYDAQLRLQKGGYTTSTQLREFETLLRSAREEVSRLKEDIEDAIIRAPSSGSVDKIAVSSGEYVSAGVELATLIENVPLRTTLRISQLDFANIRVGRVAEVVYATGQTETGRVCFVSAAADPATRTFQVEVRTPNADGAIPSGISAEVRVPTSSVMAYFVSPATLSLGTDGTLGLKTVDTENRISFHPVEIVRADAAGLWVTGLPAEASVVTLGQGFVQEGDIVEVAPADAETPMPSVTRVAPSDAGLPKDLCARTPTIGAAAVSAAVDKGEAS